MRSFHKRVCLTVVNSKLVRDDILGDLLFHFTIIEHTFNIGKKLFTIIYQK